MNSTRYEVKMTCDEVYLPDARAWVQLHPAVFVEAYPPRRVNSLYFDTLDGDCLDANLIGISGRRKLRLRWYGDEVTSVEGILELKCRESQVGWKERLPFQGTFDFTTISWDRFMQQLRERVDGQFAIWLSHVSRPTLITSYVREYYETIDHQVRITLDYDLRAYEQFTFTAPNLVSPAIAENLMVVEVKSDTKLYRRVSDVLSSLPLQVSRNSKYVNGVMGSVGGL
jgi:hypothetical protein